MAKDRSWWWSSERTRSSGSHWAWRWWFYQSVKAGTSWVEGYIWLIVHVQTKISLKGWIICFQDWNDLKPEMCQNIVETKISPKGWIIFKFGSKIEKISNLKCVERWNSGSDFFSERNGIFHSRIRFDFWIFRFCFKFSTNQKDAWSASDWWFWHILTLSSKRSKGE